MSRPSTLCLDREILILYFKGRLLAKEIKRRLGLKNDWRVYDALKRERRHTKRRAKERPGSGRRAVEA